jgi:hypothetical protein
MDFKTELDILLNRQVDLILALGKCQVSENYITNCKKLFDEQHQKVLDLYENKWD